LTGRLQKETIMHLGRLSKIHLGLMAAVVIGLNLLGWGMLWSLKNIDVAVVGIGVLAFFFGLRHAFDADHIAAIDNVTRKMRQEGKMPVGVGFFFALGHATVVLLLSMIIVFFVRSAAEGGMSWFQEWGGVISMTVSAGFLTAIGLLNLVIFKQLLAAFKRYRVSGADGGIGDFDMEALLNKRGLWARLFRGMNRHIDKSWKMFIIGFLFGFGFDTATEIAILGISATAAQSGMLPLWGVMVFPLLFAAGMTMMDTIDGVLMLKAYDWAMADAIRKLFFNLWITGLSVVLALGIGTIEWMQLIADKAGWDNPFWQALESLNFGDLGIAIVVLMFLAWGIAWWYYRKAVRQIRISAKLPKSE
jgi:high-affinity nickel-transport protein